jgi:predicted MFS family arabinose efflux permease
MKVAAKTEAWLVVTGATIALVVSNGPILFFTFSVFLKPISEEMGWSRGLMSLGVTIGLTVTGLATPLIGMLTDKWGIQKVTLLSITLFAVSFAAISFTPANVSIYVMLYAVSGLFASGHAPLPYAKAISGWFVERRGLALGIAMAGVGIGVAVTPQIARALIAALDWRATYVVLGAVVWLVAFPAVLFFVKDPKLGAGEAKVDLLQGDEVASAIRRKDFWLTLTVAFLVVTAVNGITAHLVALLTDRGVSAATAVPMLAAVGVSAIAGRLVSGYLLDRFFAPYLAAAIFFLPLVGTALLLVNVVAPFAILAAAVCFGLGLGAEVDIIGYLTGCYFGFRRYGEIYGYIFAAFAVGSGVGPFIMGASFDVTGNYRAALVTFAIALLGSIGLIAQLGPYRYRAQEGIAGVRIS